MPIYHRDYHDDHEELLHEILVLKKEVRKLQQSIKEMKNLLKNSQKKVVTRRRSNSSSSSE